MELVKVVLLLWVVSASGGKVTPVEKVITLLKALKMTVRSEGSEEAATYDKFACFCKETTTAKSTAITDGQDKIDTLTADIEMDTASKEEKDEEFAERKTKQEELEKELDEVTARCAAEMLEFEAKMQELMKAVEQLGKAISALKASKSFLQVRDQVASSLALADALGLIQEPKEQKVSAFIQQGIDPDDPEYKFHSDDIVTLLEKLETEFKTKKDETQKDWDAAKKECEDLKKGLKDEMKTNEDAMKVLEADILKLKTKIAKDKADLVLAEEALKDDSQYLKDLQFRCEDRAKDWDQRTQSRNDEVNAIDEALTILQDGKDGGRSVKALDEVANERALLVQAKNKTLTRHAANVDTVKVPVALMQLAESTMHRQSIRLHRNVESQEKAEEVLSSEGARLQSRMLSELAKRIHADPFAKVKMLIQQLLQRLLTEAAQESTKKGFCDTELAKAKQNRETRFAEIKKMAAEHQALKAEKIRLEDEIVELNDTIAELKSGLKNATEDRAEEHAENMAKIKAAKEGLVAIADAIKILKDYYKEGAKQGGAKLLQASPVDEDTEGAGFKGAYRGNTEAGGGIIAVLEVIESDFDRTVRHTTAAEKEALAAFVKLDRAMKVDIETKSTHRDQDMQDLKNTENAKAQKLTDIEDSQNLLDDAVKAIEDLKPMCIDTTMSYEDRVKKREDEIEALKKAMCLLDPDKVDAAVHGSPC